MRVTRSATRHGWSPADIRWAVDQAVLSVDGATHQPEAIWGILHLGPARDGRVLEVLVIMNDESEEVAIHAMAIRPAYRRLLAEGSR
jgi:hypothetical protein